MLIIKFLLAILIVELSILFLLVFSLYFERFFFKRERLKRIADRGALSQMINEYMHKKKVDLPTVLKLYHRDTILYILEAYERRLRGDDWNVLKREICEISLLPCAKKWVKSYFWEERNFSARCFALCSSEHDEKILLKLMDDPAFLVRKNAAIAIARLGRKEGIKKIIDHMVSERGYGRFCYRDILLHEGTIETLGIVEKIAAEEKECIAKHRACLSILSGKAMTLTYPFLKRDLESENPLIRLAAVKIYARNPQKDSAQVLIRCMEDPADKIRAEAAHGLGYFASKETVEKLELALKDPVWNVRLQAAWSLKRMGAAGRNVLEKQSPEIDRTAYDTVKYALEFDW
jgi:hypothetical protein